MSEVKRWRLKGFLPGVEGECKAVFQPTVVMAEDFDNATRLFLDAAERCVASERREKELQRRLTAADERADVLATALSRIQFRCQSFVENDCAMAVESVEAVLGIADAALKPAEGGGDDLDDHDRSGQAYWADQAAQGKPYEQQLREACERNGIAHGLDED